MTMLQDPTFVAAIALAIFVVLLIWLKVPGQIAKALDDKSAAIAKELADARTLREEAQALYRAHEAKKAAVEAEAKEIIAHAKEQAALLAKDARVEHAASLERRRRQAEERIVRAGQQAEADVRAAAADAAVQAAERMLREQLDATAHADLIARGVSDLGKKFG